MFLLFSINRNKISICSTKPPPKKKIVVQSQNDWYDHSKELRNYLIVFSLRSCEYCGTLMNKSFWHWVDPAAESKQVSIHLKPQQHDLRTTKRIQNLQLLAWLCWGSPEAQRHLPTALVIPGQKDLFISVSCSHI